MPTETRTAIENGITVYCDGQTRDLELDHGQAEQMLQYAGIASEVASVPYRELTKEEQAIRGRRHLTMKEHAGTFKTYLAMLGDLDDYYLAHVLAFLDLLEYGHSWMREVICDLLMDVQFGGPAKANERNPRDVLAEVAHNLFTWWDDIEYARSQAAQHPSLFPQESTPEPSAAEATQPTTKQPAKAQRARKARKKVARAN